MTNEELDRLTKLRLDDPAQRRELERALVGLGARGGRYAEFARRIQTAIEAWDRKSTANAIDYVRALAAAQSTTS